MRLRASVMFSARFINLSGFERLFKRVTIITAVSLCVSFRSRSAAGVTTSPRGLRWSTTLAIKASFRATTPPGKSLATVDIIIASL